ncbi:MAG: thiosulfate sulfurtransferase GlpE [Pseudomonadales bacterium]|nr:thiosulfate sulfurtransferase GlpE [Pseudomonadales bacterium]
MNFNRINPQQCLEMMNEKKVTLLDIRDGHAYRNAHIENAVHIEEINVDDFVDNTDKNLPLIIYCYHGHSSLSAAAYFVEKGFRDVYSMDGGFEDWRNTVTSTR